MRLFCAKLSTSQFSAKFDTSPKHESNSGEHEHYAPNNYIKVPRTVEMKSGYLSW